MGHNGLLVNFFSPTDLAIAVTDLLRDRKRAKALGIEARRTVEGSYDLDLCVDRQVALMDLVASGSMNS